MKKNIEEEEDFPAISEWKRIVLKYTPRSLTHEKFKNVSLTGALENLLDKPIGEVDKNNNFIKLFIILTIFF